MGGLWNVSIELLKRKIRDEVLREFDTKIMVGLIEEKILIVFDTSFDRSNDRVIDDGVQSERNDDDV